MKKHFLAILGLLILSFTACRKTADQPLANPDARVGQDIAADAAVKLFYDFVIKVKPFCAVHTLTINDCGNASYTPWQSTGGCLTPGNFFNGLVIGSGNPQLASTPPTFVNLGATYLIFDNSTSATRDVLSVTFYAGYNQLHKPTISYDATTRKFTISSVGNTAFVSVSKFSYTGVIAPGVTEFC